MTQLVLQLEPAPESMIERRRVDNTLGRWLQDCNRLRAQDWDVTVLLAPDEKTAVMVASRPCAPIPYATEGTNG